MLLRENTTFFSCVLIISFVISDTETGIAQRPFMLLSLGCRVIPSNVKELLLVLHTVINLKNRSSMYLPIVFLLWPHISTFFVGTILYPVVLRVHFELLNPAIQISQLCAWVSQVPQAVILREPGSTRMNFKTLT